MLNYELLPGHIREGVKRYIEKGIEPGSFLTAIICNDLKESFGRADETNRARMFDIVGFFYNEAPSRCWGSQETMNRWMNKFKSWPR